MIKLCCHIKVLSVLILFIIMTGCSVLVGSPTPHIPNMPRTYIAEYNRVWNSALDVLDEEGYVIAQMDKADGYITTEIKEGEEFRDKVSLRIIGIGDEVTVRVNLYYERRSSYTHSDGTKSYSWEHYSTNGHFEKRVKDTIAEKLGLTQ